MNLWMQELNYKFKCRPSVIFLVMLPLLVHCSDPVTPGGTASDQVFDYGSLPRAVGAAGLPWNAQIQRFDVEGDVAAIVLRQIGFSLLDLSNSQEPKETLRVEWPIPVLDIHLTSSYLYLLDVDTIQVLDRNAPQSAPLGTFTFPEDVHPQYMLLGRICVVVVQVRYGRALWFVDMSDPVNPRELARLPIDRYFDEVSVDENLLFIGSRRTTTVMDMTDPENIEVLSELDHGPFVAVANGFAYTTNYSRIMAIYDIRDPRNPIEISVLSDVSPGPMVVQDNRVFVRSEGFVEVVNVTDRTEPEIEGRVTSLSSGWLHVRGSRLWTLGSDFVEYDVGKVFSAPEVGHVEESFELHTPQLEGNRLFSLDQRGLYSLSIYDQDHVSSARIFPGDYSPWYRWRFYVDGDRLYLNDRDEVQVRNLASGHVLGNVPFDDTVAWHASAGDYLYVITNDILFRSYDLWVMDVSNPLTPRVIERLSRAGDPDIRPRFIQLLDDKIYVISQDALAVFDVASPFKPRLLAEFTIEGAELLAVHAGLVYVYARRSSQGQSSRLVVIDLGDPAQPRIVSEQEVQVHPEVMVAHGDALYATTSNAMTIFDISTRAHPRSVGVHSFPAGDWARALFADHGVLYVVMQNGLSILPLHGLDR